MNAGRLRAAVIGGGRIAELGHLPGYAAAGVEVVALYDRTPARLDAMAGQFGISRRTTDWRVLLDDGGFDVVSICTPPALHKEMAVEALQHGVHVLVEKPMAVTPDECQAMIDAADASGTILMIAHNQRFRGQHQVAKTMLESGRLGRIRSVHAEFAHGGPEQWSPQQTWYFDKALAGHGVLLDLGYHKLDLLCWLLGQTITSIQAVTATFEKPTSAEDSAAALMTFSGGALGTLQASWAHHPDVSDSLTIHGEKGTLFVPSDPAQPMRVLEQAGTGGVTESLIRSEPSGGPGWLGAVGAFVFAVEHSLPSPVPGSQGKAILEVVLSAYASVHQNIVRFSSFSGVAKDTSNE